MSPNKSSDQSNQSLSRVLDRILVSPLIVLDGGAKGGTRELVRLARYISAYGFEANRSEYDKIVRNPSASGSPQYKRISYLPLALAECSGKVTLYITKRPGATSTLRPNAELLAHFERDNWSQMREVVSEQVVEAISLRDFIMREHLSSIDYIKLDTQGNELHILRSAGELVQKISVIKTEVELIPVYMSQPLLGDICSFLTSQGFQLVDLHWTDPCRRYHFSPSLPKGSYRLVWAEAIFAYDPFNVSKERTLEQAIILAELGYLDLGLYILGRLTSLADADRELLLRYYQEPPGGRECSWLKRLVKKHAPGQLLEVYRILKQGKTSQSKEVTRIP